MRRAWRSILLTLLVIPAVLPASPVEFGMAEFRRALAERGLRPERYRLQTEITLEEGDSYAILPGRITGGSLRGVMYGLLAAAEQIRTSGRLSAAKASPRTAMRGIRLFLHNKDLEAAWFYSREYWDEYFSMLARNRFNRFNLVFAHQTNYLAPPYPFWLEVPEFPEVHATGITADQRNRNLEMLRYISQTAADHGVDFTLGVWEHNIQPGMQPTVEGLAREVRRAIQLPRLAEDPGALPGDSQRTDADQLGVRHSGGRPGALLPRLCVPGHAGAGRG